MFSTKSVISWSHLLLTSYALILHLYPSNLINFQSRSYDYVFHLSRIVGLAESIEHWDLLPNLNFYLHSVRDMLLLCFMEIGSLSVSHRLYDDQRWKSCLFYICILITLGTSLTSYIVISK